MAEFQCITLPLVPGTSEALQRLCDLNRLSEIDNLNRAIQLYAALEEARIHRGEVLLLGVTDETNNVSFTKRVQVTQDDAQEMA